MTTHTDDKPLYELDDTPLYAIPDEIEPSASSDPDSDEDADDDEDYDDDEEEEVIEEDEAEAEPDTNKVKRPSPMGIMFKTMLGPMEGWKELKRARLSTDEFASRCYYPMIALAAISEGAMIFYEANITIGDWAKTALSTFITFFFGYFTVLFLGSFTLPRKSRAVLKKDVGKQFVMLAMSTLALFWSAICLFPMLEPVLVFLPLWTIYIVFKGVRRLRVPQDVQSSTTGLLCMLIIGVPVLWNWIMTELLIK
jgi:uncharacterized membrane protein